MTVLEVVLLIVGGYIAVCLTLLVWLLSEVRRDGQDERQIARHSQSMAALAPKEWQRPGTVTGGK